MTIEFNAASLGQGCSHFQQSVAAGQNSAGTGALEVFEVDFSAKGCPRARCGADIEKGVLFRFFGILRLWGMFRLVWECSEFFKMFKLKTDLLDLKPKNSFEQLKIRSPLIQTKAKMKTNRTTNTK